MCPRRILSTLAVMAMLTLPSAAFAQTTPPAPSGAQAPSAGPATSAAPRQRGPRGVEQRINSLHSQLQITPAQQQVWDQFAQVMRENASAMHQALQQRADQFDTMTAADNMESYAKLSQLHAADMQKLSAAFQTVYNAMSSEQKQTADRVFRGRLAHAPRRKAGANR
jgi:periplasmic protein CpxP/Spy